MLGLGTAGILILGGVYLVVILAVVFFLTRGD